MHAATKTRAGTVSLDVAALRAQFPSLESGIAHFDGPGGTQTPAVVGEAIARTLTGPLSNRGTSVASERNADRAVGEFREAMADLLARRPARSRLRTQCDAAHLRLLARARQDLGGGRRDRRVAARPRLQRAAVGAGGAGARRRRAVAAARPGHRRARPVRPRRDRERSHAAGRRGGGIQSARHDPAGRGHRRPGACGRRARLRRRRALRRARVGGCRGPGRGFLRVLAVQVLRAALRGARRRLRRCWSRCTPTSCCPRRTRSPSGSSWARCRTRSWPASPRRSTSSPGSGPRPGRGGIDLWRRTG